MKQLLFSILIFICSLCYGQISDFAPVDFTQADKNAQVHKGASLKNLPELVNKLTLNLNTDAERFRAIYKWVCTNISNDHKLFYKNKRKRRRYSDDTLKLEAWNKKFSQRVFKKLLKKNRTLCSGYTYLVKKMADFAQLKVETINGFGRTSATSIESLDIPNHAWNAVYLNDKWYYCDPTWASGKQNSENRRFEFEYTNGFFLASPELFRLNHFPAEAKWQTIDGYTQTYQDFIDSPILYNISYDFLDDIVTPRVMYHDILKNETLEFHFKLKDTIKAEDLKIRLVSLDNDKAVTPKNIVIEKRDLKFNYTFSKTGWYDFHVYIKDNVVATYVVKIKRKQ